MPGAGLDNPRAGCNLTVACLKGHLSKKKKNENVKMTDHSSMRRHARFHAPKDGVFVTCRQLACKPGVFCGPDHDHSLFGTNTLPPSWTLKLTEKK